MANVAEISASNHPEFVQRGDPYLCCTRHGPVIGWYSLFHNTKYNIIDEDYCTWIIDTDTALAAAHKNLENLYQFFKSYSPVLEVIGRDAGNAFINHIIKHKRDYIHYNFGEFYWMEPEDGDISLESVELLEFSAESFESFMESRHLSMEELNDEPGDEGNLRDLFFGEFLEHERGAPINIVTRDSSVE